MVLGLVSTVASAQAPTIAWAVSGEYRPTLAVLEVAASDLSSIERAQQLEFGLISMLAESEQFERVTLVRNRTFEVECTVRKCFENALGVLRVQRVARVTVEERQAGSHVTLLGLDPSLTELVLVEVDVADRAAVPKTPAERDLEFLSKVLPQLRAAFWALAVPNGRLIVENADPALTVWVNGAPAGRGRLDVMLAPGDVTVSIGGALYEPFERVVTLKPGETTKIELSLVAKPIIPVSVKKPYTGLMSRPGTYLALSGATLLAVGAGLGIGSMVTGAQLAQTGPFVPVTRLQAMNAPGQAVLAGLMIASGLALSAGGIVWVALTPPTRSNVVNEPSAAGEAWMFSFGGRL
jgi:hypothetical protein